jgi:adenosine deaminase
MAQQIVSTAEALAQALWLSDYQLLDTCTGRRDIDRKTGLRIALRNAGLRDEHRAQHVAEEILDAQPALFDVVDLLCARMFTLERGLPTVRREPLARRLVRLVDPDALLSLHPSLALPNGERYDWPALPLGADDGSGLLRDGSVDTHIHLGGSLPPLFYWMALVGGDLPLEALPSLGTPGRGHAERRPWQQAVATAVRDRLALAYWLRADPQGAGRCFAQLPAADASAWVACALADQRSSRPNDSPRSIAEAAWAVGAAIRWRLPLDEHGTSFADPLRTLVAGKHYAAGERQLLCKLAACLRRALICGQPEPAVEQRLLGYLRTRNAFHQMFCHDSGSDGLLRFGENFGRRGFQYSVLRPRRPKARGKAPRREPGQRNSERRDPGRRQRRYRRMITRLERIRTTAALDAQLADAFDDDLAPAAVASSAPVRRIELRVSIPPGSMLLPSMQAWLQGLRRHIAPTEDTDTARNSQVGLVFHLVKGSSHRHPHEIARQACQAVERLEALLLSYPQLRPFVVGLDVAGKERGWPPRLYGEAYAWLRRLQASHRPRCNEPPIALGWTFHVGEDCDDLLSGLRHCDEVAAHLLDGGVGRLGHGLALAMDARRFYLQRGGEVEPTLGAHLLDLVWAWGRLIHSADPADAADALWLKDRLHAALGAGDVPDVPGCWQAMQLDPLARPADAFSGEVAARKMHGERELLQRLGLREAMDGTGDARISVIADERWMALVTRLQRLMRERLARCRITLEVNPTSNLLIAGFNDYHELPYRTMTDSGLAVSINTDDPGLFMTTLPNEFAALHHALVGPLPHHEASLWLQGRRLDAANSTFLTLRTPTGMAAAERIDSGKPLIHRLFSAE